MSVVAAPAPDDDPRVGSIDAGRRFDQALATAEGWRIDASRYTDERRKIRLDHAARMEGIAERMAAAA
jgi:hypothetical protein